MKSRINFLRDDFKPQIILLNLDFVVGVVSVSLLAILVGWFIANNQFQQAKFDGAQNSESIQQKIALIETLTKATEGRSQDPEIIARVEQRQQELDVKQQIIDELAARETQKSNAFSALMLDLASNHQADLWLTSIVLDERKLYLEGKTSDSEALPKWVNRLNQAHYFADKEFARAQMFRDAQKTLNFVLSSELDDSARGSQ